MQNNLYIPSKLKVGFQERSDTFTGKLAYVIYYDEKGKLRKEASWRSWCQEQLGSIEIDNTPQPNFTFNKGVQRDNYWGSGRSMIRVYDPRDFEFEISIANLMGLLMHSDVSKRDILEPCVYAWHGTELVLLPTNSIEYQESLKHTARVDSKFSPKDVVIGHTYITKKSADHVVYLGRFDTWKVTDKYKYLRGHYSLNGSLTERSHSQKPKAVKQHIFFNLTTRQVEAKTPSEYVAHVVTAEVHEDYASFMDKFYANHMSSPFAGFKHRPLSTSSLSSQIKRSEYADAHNVPLIVRLNDSTYAQFSIGHVADDHYGSLLQPQVRLRDVYLMHDQGATHIGVTSYYRHEGIAVLENCMDQLTTMSDAVLAGFKKTVVPSINALSTQFMGQLTAAYEHDSVKAITNRIKLLKEIAGWAHHYSYSRVTPDDVKKIPQDVIDAYGITLTDLKNNTGRAKIAQPQLLAKDTRSLHYDRLAAALDVFPIPDNAVGAVSIEFQSGKVSNITFN